MKKTYYIKWMHCISCEMIIENEFKEIEWLRVISITHKTWKIELEHEDDYAIEKIRSILEKNNYSLHESRDEKVVGSKIEKNKIEDYIIIILLFLIFGAIYYLFSNSDLVGYFWTSWTDVSVLSAFLIGIWASISTCFAMLSWIVVWFSIWKDGETKSFSKKLKTQLSFHIWRIISFVLLGWLLWWLWSFLQISPKINWIITIFISILIIYIWLNMLNILPSVSKLWLHLPKRFSKNINNNNSWPFVIWVFTFIIPCWLTQAMQAASVASWNFLSWAMIMWAFAFGTLPVLLLLWVMSSYSGNKKYGVLKKIIWVLIIFFSIIWISNSVNLIWIWNNNIVEKSLNIDNTQVKDTWIIEKIFVKHNWSSVEPYEIKLKAFIKYNLNIMPENDWIWCMTTITIPWVDENIHKIVKWEKIIFNIPALSPWTYKLVCSAMWMTHWKLVVE